MSNELDNLLTKERTTFINTECFIRQVAAKHIRGLPPTPTEKDIEFHLKVCREYYEQYGTIDGELTPWITGKGRKWPEDGEK